MNYIIIPESVRDRQVIYQDLQEVIGGEKRLSMFPDIKSLANRLKNFNNPEIITFLGVKWSDFQSMVDIKDLFLDAAIIIFLSDNDQETFDRAINMRPKYVGSMVDDLDKLIPIVKKLVNRNERYRSI